jgi:hypothetical protein
MIPDPNHSGRCALLPSVVLCYDRAIAHLGGEA